MSISASMNAGISGLTANSNKLATISDNIANSHTAGYKRADVDFAAIALAQSQRSYTAGGVRTTTLRDIEAKGGFLGTNNATDLAIAGRGMLPVTSYTSVAGGGELPLMLAPTGGFQLDANGVLRTASGLVLMGWPADANGNVGEMPRQSSASLAPVVIDRSAVAAAATDTITLNANLPAVATRPGADPAARFPLMVEYFDTLGAPQSMGFDFAPALDGAGEVQPNQWTLTITDHADGTEIGVYAITFSNDGPDAGKIDSVVPAAGSAGYDPVTGEITMTLAGNQEVTVRLGAAGGAEPQFLSQLASVYSPVGVVRDGAPAGTYTGVSIDENGHLAINYSSGFSRVAYKIPVADVPNMNGLQAVDGQAFRVTRESGDFYLWDAGTGPVGAMMGFAMEQSTTNVAAELTQLIQTQRAYSSNAKIIQTVDEMLQETTNLKR